MAFIDPFGAASGTLAVLVTFFLLVMGLTVFLLVRGTGRAPFGIERIYEEQDEQGEWRRADGPPEEPPPPRAWWGNPLLWVGVSTAFILLGLFVLPHLLGGAFLFLPFVWIARPRRAARR